MKGVSEVDKVKRLSWFGGLDVGSLFHPSVALSLKNKVGVVGQNVSSASTSSMFYRHIRGGKNESACVTYFRVQRN